MKRAARLLILIALIGIGCHNSLTKECAGADDLCGWYTVSAGNRLIPVFKIDGVHYTVMSRGGFEIPLEESPNGLEWPATPPSSMVGTKVGFDEESNEIYLSIVDRVREFTDDGFVSGKRQPLTAIDKPSWLRDATAQPPRTYDDFLGWYEPVWCPYVRGQIRKENGKYLLAFQVLEKVGDKGSWVPHSKQYELTPLPDRLGFAIRAGQEVDLTISLIFSGTQKRFELQLTSAAMKFHVCRMPQARIPPPSPEEEAVPWPPMDIGIPSWE